jgi:hypothetical protein
MKPVRIVVRLLLPVLALAGIAACQGVGSGTAVVVLRSAKVLFTAVDSKETYRQYQGGSSATEERTVCKVARVGPYYAIVAGIAHASNGFDTLRVAQSLYRPGDGLDALASRIRESLPGQLTPLLDSLRNADPSGFAGQYEGQAAVQLALVGREGGQPRVVSVEFVIANRGGGFPALSTRVMSCPGDCPSPTSAYFFGTHGKIDEFLRQHPGFTVHPDESRAEALLNLEYADRPDLVGGPVSTIRIDGSGDAMVRGGACAADGHAQ